MNDEQRRFADSLQDATPQPPHDIDIDAIMQMRVATRRFHPWPQLAAAGVVALLAAGTAVAVNHNGDDHSPAAAHSSAPAVPKSSAPNSSAYNSSAPTRRLATCGLGDLDITVNAPSRGADGHSGRDVYFRNSSGATCSLHGYPSFAVVPSARDNDDKASAILPRHAPYSSQGGLPAGASAPTNVLRTGQAAYVRLDYIDSSQWPTFVYRSLHFTDGQSVIEVPTGPMSISSYPVHGSTPPRTTLEVHPYQRGR